MARHTQRLRRMSSRLGDNPDDLERARMERMTDEELEAEAIEIAVEVGFDPAAAAAEVGAERQP